MADTKQQKAAEVINQTPPPVVEEQNLSASELGDSMSNLGDAWKKYQNIIVGILAAAILLGAGFSYFQYDKTEKDKEAQEFLFKSVYAFEADSLDKALKGKGTKEPGFISIAEEYAGTPSANQAHFYIGYIYLKKGKFAEAIESFNNFSSSDLLVQARAYCLIGDAHLEQKNYADAEKFYSKAADYYPNERFTPSYLMKLGLAQELNNNLSEAIGTYDRIITKYPNASDVMEAKKAKAKLEAATGAE